MVPRENKTMFMQKFFFLGGGGQTKSIMVFSQVAYRELSNGNSDGNKNVTNLHI